jgi:hypothetical protein
VVPIYEIVRQLPERADQWYQDSGLHYPEPDECHEIVGDPQIFFPREIFAVVFTAVNQSPAAEHNGSIARVVDPRSQNAEIFIFLDGLAEGLFGAFDRRQGIESRGLVDLLKCRMLEQSQSSLAT